jgi:hypothetical protein
VKIFLLLPEGDLDVVLVLYGSHIMIVGVRSRLNRNVWNQTILAFLGKENKDFCDAFLTGHFPFF